MAPVRKGSQPNEVAQLVAQIPPVTRFVLAAIVVLYTLVRAQIVRDTWLCFWPYHTFVKLQVWRMFTGCFLVFKGKMGTLFTMFELYTHSSHLESFHFHDRNHAEYVYLLCVLLVGVVASATALRIDCSYTLIDGMMAALTCLWSIKNWNTALMFYGLFPVKGKYNPLLQLFLSFLFDDEVATFPLVVIGFSVAYAFNCLDTRSLGPLYGYIRGKPMGYGLVNDRQFRAPRWFSSAWRVLSDGQSRSMHAVFDKTKTYQGQGRKLGSRDPSDAGRVGVDSAGVAAASMSRPKTSPTMAFSSGPAFRGKGQRVGTK
ncbi:LADA_0G13784g1_1 [Lachancea dasiensis]|uniref:Derlin n=1 Tax=Lachancea dasiensis TaxID=1072105 RepID=A0A1G4JVS5_9SACH|nr:LADA_0G13784g1_1 [Lachancea dasiensis]